MKPMEHSPPPQLSPARGGGSDLLSISIVTYQPELFRFEALLRSLSLAVQPLNAGVQISIVDHSPNPEPVRHACAAVAPLPLTVLHDPANPGFGAGHNRVIRASAAPFHLILNPDVELPPSALAELLHYLQTHPEVAALGPEVRDGAGEPQSSCKGEVTVFDLYLRGFAPRWLRQRCAARLARYECRDLLSAGHIAQALHLSGCFMLCRTAALQAVGGFDERYFLYFEDFALSRALRTQGQVLYFPLVYIVHHGGGAARKGRAHVRYFCVSAWRWFTTQGWQLW
jgi:GT2 family glycosyltransferase